MKKYSCGHNSKWNVPTNFPCPRCQAEYLREKIEILGVLFLTKSEKDHCDPLGIDIPDVRPEDAYDVPFLKEYGIPDNDFPYGITVPFNQDREIERIINSNK